MVNSARSLNQSTRVRFISLISSSVERFYTWRPKSKLLLLKFLYLRVDKRILVLGVQIMKIQTITNTFVIVFFESSLDSAAFF